MIAFQAEPLAEMNVPEPSFERFPAPLVLCRSIEGFSRTEGFG
jgi:hypothetical protein